MSIIQPPIGRDAKAFGKSQALATPDGKSMFVGVELAGINGKIYRYDRLDSGEWKLAGTITKDNSNGQLFGGVFDVDENIMVVLHPQVPGSAANLPSRISNPAFVQTWTKNGSTWIKDPVNIHSMDHDFGSAGIAVTDKLLAISTNGPSETMEKTAIVTYERTGSSWTRLQTIYPSEWGPVAGAFRFGNFDMKGDVLVGIWHDGVGGDTVNDFGPIRVYNARTGVLEKLIHDKTVVKVAMVTENMFIAASEFGADVYTRTPNKSDWYKSTTLDPPSGEMKHVFGKTIGVSKKGVAIRYSYKNPESKGGVVIYAINDNSLSYSHVVEDDAPVHYSDTSPIVLTEDDMIITSRGSMGVRKDTWENDVPLIQPFWIAVIAVIVLLLIALYVYRKDAVSLVKRVSS